MTIYKNLYLQTEHEQKCLVNYRNKCSHHNVFNEYLLCIFETNYTYMYQKSLTNEVIMFLLIIVSFFLVVSYNDDFMIWKWRHFQIRNSRLTDLFLMSKKWITLHCIIFGGFWIYWWQVKQMIALLEKLRTNSKYL